MKTKAKGDGKRRKKENIVKKNAINVYPYLWLDFNNELSTTLRIKLYQSLLNKPKS